MTRDEIPLNCIAGLDAYQMEALKTAIFPREIGPIYCGMGIMGESGEMGQVVLDIIDRMGADDPEFLTEDMLTIRAAIAGAVEALRLVESLKKKARKGQFDLNPMAPLTSEERKRVRSEGGDGLWYSACMAKVTGWDLSDIAQENIKKLRERRDAGVIAASGETIEERVASAMGGDNTAGYDT